MEILGKRVLLLGGAGLVGMAVAREMLEYGPERLVICGLTQREAESAVEELRAGQAGRDGLFVAEWGDVFLEDSTRTRSRAELLADAESRGRLLDDMYGELSDDVVERSALGALLMRHRPEIVIDCINTATAFAYQNVYNSVARLRERAREGPVAGEEIEKHLSTLYLPQLIRHVQIALESMKRAGTQTYVKIGTAGTGGMGLNVPFTHSEERPSRMLLAKSGLAGAHTLLLYLMARTPGAPAVKEIKPTAAISWKRIGYGPIQRRGRPIECVDAVAQPLDSAFTNPSADAFHNLDRPLEGVFLDAGENGLFSLGEFETLTALGLMEFITPEEIAENVVREVLGRPTGRDVVGALDAATSGPTYRAGFMRAAAVNRMRALEAEHGEQAVAYEMLGPPRLSKLLFEAAILGHLFPDIDAAAALDPEETAARAERLLMEMDTLRVRILTVGLPILLADGRRVLRGPDVKIGPAEGQPADDPRLPDSGWVDLRASNWRKWSERAAQMVQAVRDAPGPDSGSRTDMEPDGDDHSIRPGRMAAWIFRYEDRGERRKR
jgi:NAD(P)-dependent dehydrogenase (short-subunit alcohol dehydrogenase family)